MAITGRHTVAAAFVLALVLGGPRAAAAQMAASTPLLTTPHFAFFSDFATNLNQTLIADFIARRDGKPGLFASDAGKSCFDALTPAERDAWARAVEYYRTNPSTDFDRVLLRLELGGLVDRRRLPEGKTRDVLDAFATARADAAAAYRRCKWPADDAANRAWIDRVGTLLRVHEAALGEELPTLFQKAWSGLPFHVDVVDYVGYAGGNTASDDTGQPHIMVSSTHADNEGRAALEVVVHEAAHFLAAPGGPLSNALSAATTRAAVTPPRDILHQVHFFIVGEAVRRSFARAGESYTPYLYSLKLFSDGFRAAAPRIWLPYLDGTRTLDEAAADLAAVMKR